ncbi:MAG: gamma-glutamylcyclotransferase [Myxococcota bacterium]|nr:gamma-glutamylcyclotransferase [Myxococcota bacterium]
MRDLYFAYGSNLSFRRLAERIPSPESLGAGRLADYRLVFNKPSADGSAKANLLPSPGEEAWGVLWSISSEAWPVLDGFEPGYARTPCRVRDAAGQARAASVYLWPGEGREEAPYDWYLEYLLEGARENTLPPEYVRWLAAVRTRPDPSRKG